MARSSLVFIFALFCASVGAKNLLDEIKNRQNLAQVLEIIESDNLLPTQLMTQPFTAFLPSDEAMSKYEGIKDARLIRYHLANIPYPAQELPDEINTELTGNPRLYVTKVPSGKPSITGWEHQKYYINNALITNANLHATTSDGMHQYLHVIDQVIEPTVTHSQVDGASSASYLNPDAQKLLEKPRIYGLVDKFDISEFQKRVKDLNVQRVFNMSGKNTFFIPVNSAVNELIDKQVIDGHVVPNQVLFTRTVSKSTSQYESLAFTDNLKVFITMENVTSAYGDQEEMTYYVKSNTVASDVSHKRGTVLARIVKGNIPVKNGVVHLTDRPLMVVASTIMLYLQEKDGQLTKFQRLMKDHLPDFQLKLISDGGITLFAPSNEAFNMVNEDRLNQVIMNKERLERLLKLHVIERQLTTDEIIDHSTREIFQEETLSNRRKLYFAVSHPPPPPPVSAIGGGSSATTTSSASMMPVVTLEGAGVNATITTANIATKNGVIHIIDRILGIPSQTVYEKLASDPMLSSSFSLSEQKEWNKRLKFRDERFTLFVPSNDAWNYIQRTIPSAHKKLFMGEFAYHVRYILERHMIVGQAYSLEELAALTTNSTPKMGFREERLQMMRGKIYFQARVRQSFGEDFVNDTEIEEGQESAQPDETDFEYSREYYVEWNGIRAKVIRPDVECVNGIVHVIDTVLMANRDVTVSSAPRLCIFTVLTPFLALLVALAVPKGILGH